MKIPIVLGPTAVGKTSLLVELSKKFNFQIISLDSRQIYKYLHIGTAKPTQEERSLIKHHLVDFVEPEEQYDVNRYLKESKKIENDLLKDGIIPVYSGGTGLYADAVLKGIIDGVAKNSFIREVLNNINKSDKEYLYGLLKEVDPVAAKRIHANDLKRIVRYLEAFFMSGSPLSQLQNNDKENDRYQVIFLNRNRKELHERISERVDIMIEKGLFDEVLNFYKMSYNKTYNSFQTIGYSEIFDFYEGLVNREECIELIKRNTRRYARRQIIWFRRYINSVQIDLSNTSKNNVYRIFSIIFNDFWGCNYG